ncbi:MAG: putative PEP-binding protein [Planctomycetota bacterium]|jgi:phosphoenolpyruvate-protein kinase (PTS system EI component)
MASPVDTQNESQSLSGQSVSPGVAYGQVFLSMAGIDEVGTRRLKDDEVEGELARVDSVARAARVSLVHQRKQLGEHFTADQRRIFDTHLTMLEDPTIEADLRSRIVDDRLGFESALKDMLEVYERLFEVVESSNLRNKLADMRDIALRLLRFSRPPSERVNEQDRKGGILVVRELSLSDLTEALDHGITGLIAEHGSLSSHGAILTRAAGIPAIIGVGDIDGQLTSSTNVLVDGDNGIILVDPDPETVQIAQGRAPEGGFETLGPAALGDGTPIRLEATVASPSEAKQVRSLGIKTIGMYRTELPVMQRQGKPREDSLAVLYGQVVQAMEEVTFRLPDLTSASEIAHLYPVAEPNPGAGLRGVRLLLQKPNLLNLQMRALLRASEGREVRVAIPFVVDADEIRAVREAADNAREELRLEGLEVSHRVELGVIFETPASALLGRELLQACDFALIGLDTLAENLLHCDRRNHEESVIRKLRKAHPVVLRAVRKLVSLAHGLGKPIGVYGESLVQPALAQLLVGVGVTSFAVRPSILRQAHSMLHDMDLDTCERIAEQACRAGTASELEANLPPSWLG